jgi:hypothetical protein
MYKWWEIVGSGIFGSLSLALLGSLIRHFLWQIRRGKEGLGHSTDIPCPDSCPYLGSPEYVPYAVSDAGCWCPCYYYDLDLMTDGDAQPLRCEACVRKIKHGRGLEKIPA